MRCTHCGAEVPDGSRFCAACGEPVSVPVAPPAASRLCPQCGAAVDEGSRFCTVCGQPMPALGQAPAALTPDMPVRPAPTPEWRPPPPPLPAKKGGGGANWLPALIGVLAGLVVVGTGALVLVPDLRAALSRVAGRGDATTTPTTGIAPLPTAIAILLPSPTVPAADPIPSPTPAAPTPTSPAITSTPVPADVAPTEPAPATDAPTSEEPTTAVPTAASSTTAVPAATAAPTVTTAPAAPGVILSFEGERDWRRGDEPHGEFARSGEQAKSGSYAGKLAYQLPAVSNNYVVLVARPSIALGGEPTGLTAWVHGDGSGHFLNAWIQDAAGEVRQYTFGRVAHQGWAQMTAWFDDARGWPNVTISGSDNGRLDYPASLYALLVDGVPDGQASSGVIYLDDVATTSGAIVAQATAAPAQPTAAAGAPTQAPPPQGPVEVIFEYGWDGGWMGVENQGVWAAAGDGHQYVAEVGFLSSPEAIAALKAAPPGGWKGKIVVRKQVGWVSCVTDVCQEHSSDGTQALITNQIYLRPAAWTSLVNAYLSGGLPAVYANPYYATVQEKAFQPIGNVPAVPVIAFRFTRME